MNSLNGFSLGVVAEDYGSSPTTTKPAITDSIAKWLGITQQAAQTYKTITNKTGSGSTPGGFIPPPTPPAPDNTMKYVKVAGAVIGASVLGYGIYSMVRGKKGLGDLNTAKTGKAKQRGAVFAKLDEEGKAWPKNKKGVRSKKRVSKKRKLLSNFFCSA